MRRVAALLALGLMALSVSATAQQDPPLPPVDYQAAADAWDTPEDNAEIANAAADAALAAEARFADLAQTIGQWRAFHTTAHVNAIMFVPQEVHAVTWLTDRPNPTVPVRWQPHSVWTSCDGNVAVTSGGWQHPDQGVGYFTTVWMDSGSDGWRWIIDHGDNLPAARVAPAQPVRHPASCANRPALAQAAAARRAGMTRRHYVAPDGSIIVEWQVGSRGERELWVHQWNGADFVEVIHDMAAAPAQ